MPLRDKVQDRDNLGPGGLPKGRQVSMFLVGIGKEAGLEPRRSSLAQVLQSGSVIQAAWPALGGLWERPQEKQRS